MNKEQFYIWLAGFVDGEGCIRMHSAGTIIVSIYNTNRDVIYYIKSMIGFGGITATKPKAKPSYKMSYALQICGEKAALLCRKLLPYLKVKHLQAGLAIEYYEKRQSYRKLGTMYSTAPDIEEYKSRLSFLNTN